MLLWERESGTSGTLVVPHDPVSLEGQMDPVSHHLFLQLLLSTEFCLFEDPGLLGRDRIHLLTWGGSVFVSRMTNLVRRALNKA